MSARSFGSPTQDPDGGRVCPTSFNLLTEDIPPPASCLTNRATYTAPLRMEVQMAPESFSNCRPQAAAGPTACFTASPVSMVVPTTSTSGQAPGRLLPWMQRATYTAPPGATAPIGWATFSN